VVGDRPKHDDDAFSPQWGINFRIVGYTEVQTGFEEIGTLPSRTAASLAERDRD
jgi:hypothetical protein